MQAEHSLERWLVQARKVVIEDYQGAGGNTVVIEFPGEVVQRHVGAAVDVEAHVVVDGGVFVLLGADDNDCPLLVCDVLEALREAADVGRLAPAARADSVEVKKGKFWLTSGRGSKASLGSVASIHGSTGRHRLPFVVCPLTVQFG